MALKRVRRSISRTILKVTVLSIVTKSLLIACKLHHLNVSVVIISNSISYHLARPLTAALFYPVTFLQRIVTGVWNIDCRYPSCVGIFRVCVIVDVVYRKLKDVVPCCFHYLMVYVGVAPGCSEGCLTESNRTRYHAKWGLCCVNIQFSPIGKCFFSSWLLVKAFMIFSF